jgi:hypothetical protein
MRHTATIALCLALSACATSLSLKNEPGESQVKDGVYVNRTYDLAIRFRNPDAGWTFWTGASDIAGCGNPNAILCGVNHPYLMTVLFTLDDAGFAMSNEDYQLLQEEGLTKGGVVFSDSKTDPLKVRGQDALVWSYRTDDAQVVAQAFFARGTQNYRLIFIVPEQAWAKRRPQVMEIIKSVDLGSGAAGRALAAR